LSHFAHALGVRREPRAALRRRGAITQRIIQPPTL
jgi:hypothetical protein